MSGIPSGHSQTTVDLSFRLVDSATLPDYRAPPRPTGHILSSHRALYTSSLIVVVLRKIKPIPKRESGRYIHSPVQSATRLAAYHIYGM